MIYLNSPIVMVLCLQIGMLCAELCDDSRSVSGAEGGDVTLPINKEEFKEVSWVFGGRHIATTYHDGYINIKSLPLFKTRLYGIRDGSLNLTNVGKGHKGTYTATLYMQDGTEFVQCFSLSVYKKLLDTDIQIHHVTGKNDTCYVSLTCTVKVPGVNITWTDSNGRTVSVTNQTLYDKYTDTNVSYNCVAKNPVSEVSRTVIPWMFCQKGKYEYEWAKQNLIFHESPCRRQQK
ncbi:SLAM family member 7-like [Spea bombifrons]|uniref:SLAM family member 7-like n=1 Tax=Spea bombifrons TaxID=233779 RepID=UPI00234AC53A|nr:SLAM family member 7-like [Spea bombifrons]